MASIALIVLAVSAAFGWVAWWLSDRAYAGDSDTLVAGSQVWYAGGTWLLAIVSAASAFTVVAAYSRSKRVESARLVKEIYDKWFFDPILSDFREALEDPDRWHESTAPALQHGAGADEEPSRGSKHESHRKVLKTIDTGLNYLEFMVQMKNEKSIADRHLDSFLHYWIDSVMRYPQRKELREYIFRWGWFGIQNRLVSQPGRSFYDEVVLISAVPDSDPPCFRGTCVSVSTPLKRSYSEGAPPATKTTRRNPLRLIAKTITIVVLAIAVGVSSNKAQHLDSIDDRPEGYLLALSSIASGMLGTIVAVITQSRSPVKGKRWRNTPLGSMSLVAVGFFVAILPFHMSESISNLAVAALIMGSTTLGFAFSQMSEWLFGKAD